MQLGDLITGVTFILVWLVICSDANPTVTINPVSSIYFDVGGAVSFVCEVNQDIGVTRIYFLRNNTTQVTISPSTCTVLPSIIGDPHTYNSTCSQGRIFTLRINGVRVEDHRITWSCQVVTSSGTCAFASGVRCGSPDLSIILRVAVTSLQLTDISGQTFSNPVSVRVESNTYFKCNTSPNGSRPKATFRWYKKTGSQVPVAIEDQTMISSTPDPIQVPGQTETDLVISYSMLTLVGNKQDQNVYIFCSGQDETNTGNEILSGMAQLNIVYPPVVSLLPNYSVFSVTEYRQSFVLTCNVEDANPQPQQNGYKWLYKSVFVPGETSSTYTIQSVQKSHDGEYRCIASNLYGDGTSKPFYLSVQYGPSIAQLGMKKVEEGDNLSVTCNVSANPPAIVMWTRSGEQTSQSAVLNLPSISRKQDGNYTCTARNVLYPTGLSPDFRQASETLGVHVLYGPGNSISLSPYSSQYEVEEGQTAETINCTAACNPGCSYIWLKGSTVIYNTSTLSLGTVHRNNTGNYTCKAYNTLLARPSTSTVVIQVMIKYGATIINLSVVGNSTVNENNTASLICIVDSYPSSNITWIKEETEGFLQTNYSVLQSQFTIQHVQCIDTGNYTCRASNGLVTSVKKWVPLFVNCHPRPDNRFPPKTKVYGKLRTSEVLRYTVIAYPLPKFTWTFVGNGSESRSLPDSVSQHDDGQESQLKFTSLDIIHFGKYFVTANNSLPPPAKEVFEIIPADVPEVPSNVTVIEVTHNSAKVQWVANFNGGQEQTFHIITSAGDHTKSVSVSDPGYRKIGTAVLEGLLPNTNYIIYMIVNNSLGPSMMTQTISFKTLEEFESTSPTVASISAVAGGTVAGIVVILLVVVAIFLRRRYQHPCRHSDEDLKELKKRCKQDSGLTDNPVYDGTDNLSCPSNSTGAAGTEYAAVVKPKHTKKDIKVEDPNTVYAQVDKMKSKTEKKGASKGKPGKTGKTPRGEIYENAIIVKRSIKNENVYGNSENVNMDSSGENVYENPAATTAKDSLVTKDELLYADLQLGPSTKKAGKPVIHGLENRTEYAEIAYGKRGEPLPENDDEKESDSAKKNSGNTDE